MAWRDADELLRKVSRYEDKYMVRTTKGSVRVRVGNSPQTVREVETTPEMMADIRSHARVSRVSNKTTGDFNKEHLLASQRL